MSLLVSNYLHLLNAGEKLEVKLFNIIRIFGFSCCLFLFHLCRASLCVCEWDIEYMSLNAIPSKCVYTSPYCVPFHMFYQFQVYRHLLCICRVIQVQSTIFLIRRKCRTHTHLKPARTNVQSKRYTYVLSWLLLHQRKTYTQTISLFGNRIKFKWIVSISTDEHFTKSPNDGDDDNECRKSEREGEEKKTKNIEQMSIISTWIWNCVA